MHYIKISAYNVDQSQLPHPNTRPWWCKPREGWGIPAELPDGVLLERLRELSLQTLKDICLSDLLNPLDADDREFINHFGGLSNLKRATRFINAGLVIPCKQRERTQPDAVREDDPSAAKLAEIEPFKVPICRGGTATTPRGPLSWTGTLRSRALQCQGTDLVIQTLPILTL